MTTKPSLGDILAFAWRGLNAASNFARDWYGEFTNQVGHIALGAFSAIFFVNTWFLWTGSMPYRGFVFLAVFAPYVVVIEFMVQKWKPGDAWFDSVMFAHGAAGVLLPFFEVGAAGRISILEYNPVMLSSVMASACVFLFPRVYKRIRRQLASD